MKTFYKLKFAQKNNEIFVESVNKYDKLALKIGEFKPVEPFKVKISEGKKMYDIVRFQDPFNFAISKKTYDLLKEANFSGWEAYKISIEESDKNYYGFQVLGKSGEIKKPKKTGFVVGCELDYGSWDKSDFFCPEGMLMVFCSEKVKHFFEKNNITNIEFEDISKTKWYNK